MKLKEFLENHRWTIAKLSRATGISRQSLYNYINGSHKPLDEQVNKLAEVLGISRKKLNELLK